MIKPPDRKICDGEDNGGQSMTRLTDQQKIPENPDIAPLAQAHLISAKEHFPAAGGT